MTFSQQVARYLLVMVLASGAFMLAAPVLFGGQDHAASSPVNE